MANLRLLIIVAYALAIACFVAGWQENSAAGEDAGWYALSAEERHCLIENVYHEARGEPDEGQVAVAVVTLNRVADDRWPDTICAVVWQPAQFSWTMYPDLIQAPRDKQAMWRAEDAAFLALASDDTLQDATHYHADYVEPWWAQHYERVTKIGAHIFYR